MIDYINLYYNLFPKEIKKVGNNYLFFYDNKKYVLTLYDRDINELDDLVKLNIDMVLESNNVSEIIFSKNGPIINFDDKMYILLLVKVIDRTITIKDIYEFMNIKIKNEYASLNRFDWKNLWSKKIDYFEYQILHKLKTYLLLNSTVDYYIGLSENALSYFNYVDINNAVIGVMHKRLDKNSTLYDLFNPINLIIDFKVRDLSEYIKSLFFSNIDVKDVLRNILSVYYFDKTNLSLLVSRLLFPTYYFDLFESIVINDLDENIMMDIIKKSSSYEDLIYSLISNNNLLSISWIK